jgi:hypothetical protein
LFYALRSSTPVIPSAARNLSSVFPASARCHPEERLSAAALRGDGRDEGSQPQPNSQQLFPFFLSPQHPAILTPEALLLLDLGRALTFLLSILSLYALVDTAFFVTATTWQQRLLASIARVVLAACVSFVSGLLFHLHTNPNIPISRTLPVRIFLWTLAAVIVLFTLAWLLDAYYVPLLWKNQPYLF